MWLETVEEIERTGLSFDEFLALYKLYSYENNTKLIDYSSDMLNTYVILESKRFIKIITDENDRLTFHLREEGNILIEGFLNQTITHNKPVITEKKDNNKLFEEFWSTFPTSDEHSIYKRTRFLKAGKDNCKRKYIEYLKQGVNHEDIIKALKYEIKVRKDNNNGQNKMTYMKNSLTWLNQREFEIILETIDEDRVDNSSEDWTSNTV